MTFSEIAVYLDTKDAGAAGGQPMGSAEEMAAYARSWRAKTPRQKLKREF